MDIIKRLSEKYILDNPEEIEKFLRDNQNLIDVILDAYDHIKRVFGDYPIHLELYIDHEYPDWKTLFIIVKTDYTSEKVIELENKLMEEWWLKLDEDIRMKLVFTEEPL